MNGAIVTTWGTPVRGREAKGLEVFAKALAYFDDLAKQGRVHGHREYVNITGNSTVWAGTMIVDGELSELLKIQTEEPTRRLVADAEAITQNFTQTVCVGGDEKTVMEQVGLYTDELQKLGYY